MPALGIVAIDEHESAVLIAVGEHIARADIKPPAAQRERAGLDLVTHYLIGHQVLELRQHIELRELVMLAQARVEPVATCQPLGRRVGMMQPLRQIGRQAVGLAAQHRLHRTALGMSADHDVGHLQHRDRVLDRTGLRQVAFGVALRIGRRHEIADIAHGKEVARLGRNHQVGHDTAVGAGDEQGIRHLLVSQIAEALRIIGQLLLTEFDDSPNEFFHGGVLSGWSTKGRRRVGRRHRPADRQRG